MVGQLDAWTSLSFGRHGLMARKASSFSRISAFLFG
jgi:hypothetical protein